METAIVLFNRDLRVDDHPALAEAARCARRVVPLFVIDDGILSSGYASANRLAFLLDSLHDLRRALRRLGADLVVRRGDPVAVATGLVRDTGAGGVFASTDVTEFAARREHRLERAGRNERFDVRLFSGVAVVPAGELVPEGSDHFKVFTPYWRAWRRHQWRAVDPLPARLTLPREIEPGRIPSLADLTRDAPSPMLCAGGAAAGRDLLARWLEGGLEEYADGHDALADEATSRLSAYLHFGCLSPLEVATQADRRPGGGPFVRQLCWRDFHHQVTAAFPAIAHRDYRSRGDRWRRGRAADEDLAAWREARTGYPIVDAGLRQLQQEGWMHNRARLVAASFLVKDLYLDWRLGARHFLDWLVDGDIANNSGNWQWVAGTGNDTRPHRMFNPVRQAERFDPDGDYVRRYVPELAPIDGKAAHRPWRLGPLERQLVGYPDAIVDHEAAVARLRERRFQD